MNKPFMQKYIIMCTKSLYQVNLYLSKLCKNIIIFMAYQECSQQYWQSYSIIQNNTLLIWIKTVWYFCGNSPSAKLIKIS